MTAWTTIASSRLDADSPVDEDLTTDLNDNDKYNFERAVRAGTHTTGARLAIARGEEAITFNTDANGDDTKTATITFSSDSVDGNPNFGTAPIVLLTMEELSSGDDFGASDPAVSAWIDEGGPTTTTVPIAVSIQDGTPNSSINILVHWVAFGLVTSGE